MEIEYDEEADAVYVRRTKGNYHLNIMVDNETILDLDKKGVVRGIEFLNLGKKELSENLYMKIERDTDGFFVSEIPELKGCHTQAKNLIDLIKRTRVAVLLYLSEEQKRKNLRLVERTIRDHYDYPTKKQINKILKGKLKENEISKLISYLQKKGKIMVHKRKYFWTYPCPKLRMALRNSKEFEFSKKRNNKIQKRKI
jgi:uncharacterized protein YuzE